MLWHIEGSGTSLYMSQMPLYSRSRQDQGKNQNSWGYLLLGIFKNKWLTRDWIKHLIIFQLMILSLSMSHIIVHESGMGYLKLLLNSFLQPCLSCPLVPQNAFCILEVVIYWFRHFWGTNTLCILLHTEFRDYLVVHGNYLTVCD